jgi:hypothetical protein
MGIDRSEQVQPVYICPEGYASSGQGDILA